MSRQALAQALPAPGGAAWALAGLLALATAVGIGRFAFTPILPMMQEDSGVTISESGWLASANYIGYLVGALWASAQPVRPDWAVRIALLITSLATVAMVYADGFIPWLLLRALAGISSAWALIYVSSLCLEQLAPLRRPLLNGLVFAGVGAGIALSGVVCLALMMLDAGSSDAWLALGVIGLLLTAAVWPVFRVHDPAGRTASTARVHWTFDAVRLVACYGAFGLGYIIPATYVPVLAKRVVEEPGVFGWAWPIFGAAAMASTLCAAALMGVRSPRRLWMLSALAMALGVASPVVIPGLGGIAVAALVVGGTFMVTTMAGIQEARRVAGAAASLLVAAMTAAFAAGQVVGPLLVSALVGRSQGLSDALLVACVVLIASVLGLAIPKTGEAQ
ncbi:MAG TPA: YbfB/YjiJ family MFS transporter [Steroidobacteraceae bacterium]